MSKKKILILSYFIALLFLFVGTVKAATFFTVQPQGGDLLLLRAKHITHFEVSIDGGVTYTPYCTGRDEYDSREQLCYISVQNGSYRFKAVSNGFADGSTTAYYPTNGNLTVDTSCTDYYNARNLKGEGQVERCFRVSVDPNNLSKVTYKGLWRPEYRMDNICASGYNLQLGVVSDTCNLTFSPNYTSRLCKVIYSYKCTKDNSFGLLGSLSVDGFSLSPGFAPYTYDYTVNVPAGTSSVKINATASIGSFQQGYGPRTVTLTGNKTTAQLKVAGPGGVNNYNIVINRAVPSNPGGSGNGGGGGGTPAPAKDTDNKLKRITVDKGELTPAFNPETKNYTVNVGKDVDKIGVGADLNSSKAKFVAGYEPRNVALNPGLNKVLIKVVSEAGVENTYTISVIKPGSGTCNADGDKAPLLKEIILGDVETEDMDEDDLEDLRPPIDFPDFDPETFEYYIEVPNEYEILPIEVFVQTEGDTYEIEGNKKPLLVNEEREIVISVTDKECPDTVYKYTLYVTRLNSEDQSSELVVEDIIVKSKKNKKVKYDIDFEQNKTQYKITVNKGETGLVITPTFGSSGGDFEVIEEFDKFGKGAVYTVNVFSEDESNDETYTIKVTKVKSGASSILIIILIIIIVLILIYVVLRLMGYRIYFNPAMLGAAMRGDGKDKFDK